jgi:hypothetical protein
MGFERKHGGGGEGYPKRLLYQPYQQKLVKLIGITYIGKKSSRLSLNNIIRNIPQYCLAELMQKVWPNSIITSLQSKYKQSNNVYGYNIVDN